MTRPPPGKLGEKDDRTGSFTFTVSHCAKLCILSGMDFAETSEVITAQFYGCRFSKKLYYFYRHVLKREERLGNKSP
jgi:hypothetical protein